jgi:hypothetical protein
MKSHMDVMDTAIAMGLDDAFLGWLDANWGIWDEFCDLAELARLKGRTRWSARAILHVLRWHRMVRDSGGTWKINNNWSAPLSRLYNALAGFDFFQERNPALSAAGYLVPSRSVDASVTVG